MNSLYLTSSFVKRGVISIDVCWFLRVITRWRHSLIIIIGALQLASLGGCLYTLGMLSSLYAVMWMMCLFVSVQFLPARRYASAGLFDSDVSVCPSVRPSVCHTPVLCLAERKQDREMYTI